MVYLPDPGSQPIANSALAVNRYKLISVIRPLRVSPDVRRHRQSDESAGLERLHRGRPRGRNRTGLYAWRKWCNSLRMLKFRNATEITSPSDWPYRPSSVLRQQLHSGAICLLSRLEYERSFGARRGGYFVCIP
jgi:hypothetical protein